MKTTTQHRGRSRPSRFTGADRLLALAPMFTQNRPYARRYKLRPPLQQIASEIAAQHGVCLSTVWSWYGKYKRGGYAALSHTRSDAGCSRYFRKHPDVAQMIHGRIAPGRSPFAIWNSLRLVLGREAPSYKVVLNYMKGRYSSERRLERAA